MDYIKSLVFVVAAIAVVSSLPAVQRPAAAVTNSSPWQTTRQWMEGEGGRVKYGQNCDYRGSDIAQVRSSRDQCAPLCLDNGQCTHFTYTGNTCYLKKASRMTDLRVTGSTCGWAVGRSKQWLNYHPTFSISHL